MHFVKASKNYECGMFSLEEVTHELWEIASAQPEIIHCEYCRYSEYDQIFHNRYCHHKGKADLVGDDFFCAAGRYMTNGFD